MIARKKRKRNRSPVVSTVGFGVSKAEAAAKAARAFQGELMACALCPMKKRSDPDTTTDWRIIELDDRRFYVCARHFPPDSASSDEFRDAYAKIIPALHNLRRH